MADSTEYHVWDEMTENMINTKPYEDKEGLMDFLNQHITAKGSLLDVGCNLGLYDQIFVDAGFTVIGVDQVHRAIEQAKKNVPDAHYYVQDATKIFWHEAFDVIFTNTVTQHMRLPVKQFVLANIYNALKPGGIYYMRECTFDETNWNSVPNRCAYHEDVSDGYSYTVKGWKELLTRFGFIFVEKHKAPDKHWYIFRKPLTNCYLKNTAASSEVVYPWGF